MADISKELAEILEATYGEDVRGSIYDAIDAINTESESTKQVATGAKDSATASASAAQNSASLAAESADKAASIAASIGDITEIAYPKNHRNIFRGKSLGTQMTDAQLNSIYEGTFEDLFIGDYWTLTVGALKVKWIIVDFDYYPVNATYGHHVVLLPATGMYGSGTTMNDTDSTFGGYKSSSFYTNYLSNVQGLVQSFLGNKLRPLDPHVISSSVDANGNISAYDYVNISDGQYIDLLTEPMVRGYRELSSISKSSSAQYSGYESRSFDLDTRQLAFFQLGGALDTSDFFWLRDPSDSYNYVAARTEKSNTSFLNFAASSIKTIIPYCAVQGVQTPVTTYAYFDSSTGVLTFDKSSSVPSGAYTGFESSKTAPPWYNDGIATKVTKVVFNTIIKPVSLVYWFYNFYYLTEIEGLSNLDTSEAASMYRMFYNCRNLTSLDLHTFDTGKVTDMRMAFFLCTSLRTINISSWNTSKVTNMQSMFQNCSSLVSIIGMDGLDTSKASNISYMFSGCRSLTSLTFGPKFIVPLVTSMRNMFADCEQLQMLDLRTFTESTALTDTTEMFKGCINLKTIYEGLNVSNVSSSTDMFLDCESLIGSSTTYNPSIVDKTYAKVDGGTIDPGYFHPRSMVDPSLNIHTFLIYDADNGMNYAFQFSSGSTFSQWVQSSYNTGLAGLSIVIRSDLISLTDGTNYYDLGNGTTDVYETDTVMENHKYTFSRSLNDLPPPEEITL